MFAIMWWFIGSSLIGWMCFPITFRIFSHLPSRGYAFTRGISLLIWGYLFWLLTSLGVLKNTLLGQLFVLGAIILFLLYWGFRRGFGEIRTWFSIHKRFVLGVELVFLVAYAAFVVFRAASPGIIGTEKPMELAFLNGILRATKFPPPDPWLSGYSISYYYFGYLLVAMLTGVSGTVSSVAFNLAQAFWFALTASSIYGLLVDLFALNQKGRQDKLARISGWMLRWALMAPLLLLVLGNVFGMLDVLHARGVFWHNGEGETPASAVWAWVGLPALERAPSEPYQWVPERPGVVSWWHASRVVQDRNYSGEPVEMIDEFPNFTFVLGDLHPHLLAMPFVLITIGLALDFFHSTYENELSLANRHLLIRPGKYLLISGLIGALAFLNTWDWPVYASLYAAVYLIKRIQSVGWALKRVFEFILYGLGIAVLGFVFYLPFFLSFSSQAGGILPSVIYFTRGIHLWVMFGPFLTILTFFLIREFIRSDDWAGVKKAALIVGGLVLILVMLNIVISWIAVNISNFSQLFMTNQGASDAALITLLWTALVRRLTSPGAWLTLGGVLILSLGLLIKLFPKISSIHLTTKYFVILLILWGVLLVFLPEFIYLLDGFGKRMNTIFKFYFQAWILWSLVGAFIIGTGWQKTNKSLKLSDRLLLWSSWIFMILVLFFTAVAPMAGGDPRACPGLGCYFLDWLWVLWGIVFIISVVYFMEMKRWGGLFQTVVVFSLGAGLFYPVLAIPARANARSSPAMWTLDGSVPIREENPDLMAAVDWFWENEASTLVEAVGPGGGDYSNFARVSMLTGLPTVLGWQFHEVQWRGGTAEIGSRHADIRLLYETDSWETAQGVIDKYNIEYIYIGDLEQQIYMIQEEKFIQHLSLVFHQGSVKVYRHRE